MVIIVAIVLGVLALVILVLVLLYYWWRRRGIYSPGDAIAGSSDWDDPRHLSYVGPDLPAVDEYPLEELQDAPSASSSSSKGVSNPSFLADHENPVSDL